MGVIAEQELLKTPTIRSEIELDVFQIMPNHIHCIVNIIDVMQPVVDPRRGDRPVAQKHDKTKQGDRPVAPTGPKPKSIGAFVAGYKSSVTTKINILRNSPGQPVWQRNFHDHIIRSEESYLNISEYIIYNPEKWAEDRFYME